MSRAVLMRVLLGVALLATATGCASKNKKMSYNVRVDVARDSFRSPDTGKVLSLEVDVIGANESEEPRVMNIPIDTYFDAGSVTRRDLKPWTATFTDTDTTTKKLSKRSQYWKEWKAKGAGKLFVVAHLPAMPGESEEAARSRKMIELPLLKKNWKGSTLKILVTQSGVVCTTPRKK